MNTSEDRVRSVFTAPIAPARTHPQEHTGCRCRECYSLAEFMLEETGRDYGLPRTTPVPHAPVPSVEHRGDCICDPCRGQRAVEAATEQLKRRHAPRQPWEARPARRAA